MVLKTKFKILFFVLLTFGGCTGAFGQSADSIDVWRSFYPLSDGDWWDNTATVNDPNSLGQGTITYNIIEKAVGWDNTKFSKTGGTNLVTAPL